MVKDETILILAAAGGLILWKTDFFKGLSGVSSGVGEAVSGVGSAVGFSAQEAAGFLAAGFQAGSGLLRETGTQAEDIVRETGGVVTTTLREVKESVPVIVGNVGDVGVQTSSLLSDVAKFTKETWSPYSETSIWQNWYKVPAALVGTAFEQAKTIISTITPSQKTKEVRSSGNGTSSSSSSSKSALPSPTPTSSNIILTSTPKKSDAVVLPNTIQIIKQVLKSPTTIVKETAAATYQAAKSLLRRIF